MRKVFLLSLALIAFASCRKRGISQTEISNQALGPIWKAYAYSKNGTDDSLVIKRKPTFEFRLSNSKLYITKIGPAFYDTMSYQFANDFNIKANKPGVSTAPVLNFFIDKIDDSNFDFTLTYSTNSDVEKYKTSK